MAPIMKTAQKSLMALALFSEDRVWAALPITDMKSDSETLTYLSKHLHPGPCDYNLVGTCWVKVKVDLGVPQ